jgi:hypothetical protein
MAVDITSNGAHADGGPKVPSLPEVVADPPKSSPVEKKIEPTTPKAAAAPSAAGARIDLAVVSAPASDSEPESVEEEDAMIDEEAEAMADAEEEVGAAQPKPKRSISDIDWTEAGFKPEPKRHRLVWIAVLALGALALVLLLLLFPHQPSPDSVRANQTVATPEIIAPEPTKGGASNFPSPPASLPPARVKTPKSLSDLRIGDFVLNPRRSGGDLLIISGDIENVSENLHRGIRVELDLLDAQGLKVSTARQFMTELAPRAIWHVLAPTSNARVVSARLTGIKEDP